MQLPEVSHFESLYPAESRFAEIEKMLGFIKQGQSCQVVGLPGSGQSTFLKLLAHNKNVRIKHLGDDQNRYHFVLTNFSEVKKRPLVDVTKFMFLSLVDSLRDRGLQEEYEKSYAILKESITLNDELVMFQALKHAIDILTLEKNLTIIFLFDRFETYIPMLTDEFFGNLRVLRNRAKYQFSAVFSLNRPLEDSVEPLIMVDFADFLNGHHVYLPIMDTIGAEFRIQHLESISRKTLDDTIKKTILDLTGGFGRLTKNSLQIILSSTNIPPKEKLADFLLSHPSILSPLNDIWNTLSPSEQDFLVSNTEYETSDQDYPYLAQVGLLNQGKITIPLLNSFMLQTIATNEQEFKEDPITYDATTNEIKQGATILSDKLTSSEFRLLHYLLEHAETIIDRETIIGAVWKETATTAGVTDQALDQLLFRVRKKIEEDPNNPKHVQTIKGRGIKFTP